MRHPSTQKEKTCARSSFTGRSLTNFKHYTPWIQKEKQKNLFPLGGLQRTDFVCFAKKSKSTSPKQSKMIIPENSTPWKDVDTVMLLLLLVESFSRKTGRLVKNSFLKTAIFRPLLENVDVSKIADALFEGPFCLLAHDFEEEQPIYIYANQAALNFLSSTWDNVIGSPSNLFDQETFEKASEEGKLCSSRPSC